VQCIMKCDERFTSPTRCCRHGLGLGSPAWIMQCLRAATPDSFSAGGREIVLPQDDPKASM
jgi:hypothetical protein